MKAKMFANLRCLQKIYPGRPLVTCCADDSIILLLGYLAGDTVLRDDVECTARDIGRYPRLGYFRQFGR